MSLYQDTNLELAEKLFWRKRMGAEDSLWQARQTAMGFRLGRAVRIVQGCVAQRGKPQCYWRVACDARWEPRPSGLSITHKYHQGPKRPLPRGFRPARTLVPSFNKMRFRQKLHRDQTCG